MGWSYLGEFMKVQGVNSAFTGSLTRLGEEDKTIRLTDIEVYIIIYQIFVSTVLA